MTADLTAVVNALFGLASAAALTAIPILVPAILKRFGIANNAAMAAQFDTIATAGAGAAYNYALQHEGGLANVAVHNDAIAHGLNYVLGKAPDLMKTAGLTPDAVSSAVAARLGALLATDPTVTAGKPVPGQNPIAVTSYVPAATGAAAGYVPANA